MSLSLTNRNESNLSLTLRGEKGGIDDFSNPGDFSNTGTFGNPTVQLTNRSKPSLSLTNRNES